MPFSRYFSTRIIYITSMSIGHSVLISMLSFNMMCAAMSQQFIRIPDSNLRAAIAKALGKNPDDSIDTAEMETLTELRLNQMGIESLSGLESAKNLRSVSLSANSISDISALSSLTLIFRIIDLCNLEFSYTRSWGIYSQTRKNHQGTTVGRLTGFALPSSTSLLRSNTPH